MKVEFSSYSYCNIAKKQRRKAGIGAQLEKIKSKVRREKP